MRVNVLRTVLVLASPFSTLNAPLARTEGTLNEKAFGEPMPPNNAFAQLTTAVREPEDVTLSREVPPRDEPLEHLHV